MKFIFGFFILKPTRFEKYFWCNSLILSIKLYRFYHKLFLFCFICLANVFAALSQAPENLRFEDFNYHQNIKTALLYSRQEGSPLDMLAPPIVPLGRVLTLEFDWLSRQQTFRAKIYHCNADWQPSVLSEIEYLPEYNDFPINDFRQSFATKVPYFHYTLELVAPKLSGNYVVMVYQDRNPNQIILSRRFMVYQNSVSVGANVQVATYNDKRRSHQQVDFKIAYGNYDVIDPQNDFLVLVRQNYRYNKQLTDLKPFMLRPESHTIDYQFFEGENLFEGLNEFYVVDARSLQMKLFNVGRIDQENDINHVWAVLAEPQIGKTYIETNDYDGLFVIDNRETNRGATEADYIRLHVGLKMPQLTDRDIYLNGAFNYWQQTEENRMKYDPVAGVYEANVMLKQGMYSYNFLTVNPITKKTSEREIDGSHAVTQNDYEVLVYHRPIGGRADALVGYSQISFNRRR
jgi:hypothetical protein